MKNMFSQPTGYTGRLVEKELFGETVENERAPDLEDYCNYNRSVGLVKESQPFDNPSEPDTFFADDMLANTAIQIKEEDFSKFRFFTAVNSHLDKYHGVDAFIEYDHPDAGVVRITLDVTTNPAKGDSYKADVIILWPQEGLDPKLDKEDYRKKLNEVSDRISEIIEKKVSEKQNGRRQYVN